MEEDASVTDGETDENVHPLQPAVQPRHRLLLFAVHTAFSMCQRMWEFSMVIFLADLVPDSLVFVALLGIAENVLVFAFSGPVGNWLDRNDRLKAVATLLAAKGVIFVLTMALLLWQFSMPPSEWDDHHARYISAYSIPLLAAAAGLCFSSTTLAMEKDWVVVLSGSNSEWLSHTNSVMSQIDLACESLGPALMGVIFATMPMNAAVMVISTTNLVAVTVAFFFLKRLYQVYPPLQVRPHPSNSSASDGAAQDQSSTALASVNAFLRCGCATYLVAFAMLFLTVLSFHSLMTAYILWRGLHVFWVGLGRGLSAVTGFLGAAYFPYAVKRVGLVYSATAALWFQFILVAVAGISFFVPAGSDPTVTLVLLLITPIVVSRAGLWLFDLAIRQLAQETIREAERGAVNGVWRSLTALFELAAYALALWLDEPRHFWILSTISVAMVGGAVVLVTRESGIAGTLLSALRCLTPVKYHKLPGELELADHSNFEGDADTSAAIHL